MPSPWLGAGPGNAWPSRPSGLPTPMSTEALVQHGLKVSGGLRNSANGLLGPSITLTVAGQEPGENFLPDSLLAPLE
jgi:hypothetical protein